MDTIKTNIEARVLRRARDAEAGVILHVPFVAWKASLFRIR